MRLRSADFRRILRPNAFFNRKLALRSRILFASAGKLHRPRSHSPLPFDIVNINQIRMETYNTSTPQKSPIISGSFAKNNLQLKTFMGLRHPVALAAMLQRWPLICIVNITFGLQLTSWFVSICLFPRVFKSEVATAQPLIFKFFASN